MSSTNATTDRSLDATLDATLDVLSHSTRRYLLWYLARESGRVPVETLAAAVAAWRTGDGEIDGGRTDGARTDSAQSKSESDPDARRSAHVSLRHVHLPRLESAGLIERTSESGAEYVEATTDGTPVETFLETELLGEFSETDRP